MSFLFSTSRKRPLPGPARRRRLRVRGVFRSASPQAGRSGATLIEVLMSLMVMGIGVVAVASLFPASVLRSVQATQLTNATILRYNVEGLLTTYPELLDDVTVPTTGTKRAWVDPVGAMRFHADGTTASVTSVSGLASTNSNYVERFRTSLFYSTLPTNDTDKENAFSNTNRYCSLDDSWVSQLDFPNATVEATQATLTGADLSIIPAIRTPPTILPVYRILIFDANENITVAREITRINGQIVEWDEEDTDGNMAANGAEDFDGDGVLDTNNLPSSVLPSSPTTARVRIEMMEPRYSWLLTVRKDTAGVSNVDIVIFFRRSFGAEDEKTYALAAAPANGAFRVTVPAGDKPQCKKGSYVFDMFNARWHRIQKVKVNSGNVELLLENSPRSLGNNNQGNVIFPRGVIEVYPIGNKIP